MNIELRKNKNIYNKNNLLITKSVINKILSENGIKEKCDNLKLWQESLTLFVYAYNKNDNKKHNNFNYHKKYAGICKEEKELFDKFCLLKTKKDKLNLVNGDKELFKKYNLENVDITDWDNIVDIQDNSNDKLEWVGNRFLQTVTALYLKYKFTKANEIFLTNMQVNKLLTSEILSQLAKYIGIDKYMLISNHLEKNRNGRNNPKYLKSIFTSFISVIFFDLGKKNFGYGIYLILKFFKKVFEKCFNINDLILKNNDSKHLLVKYFHKNFDNEPTFKSISESKENNFIMFKEGVYYNNKLIASASALNKKDAQKKAAQIALTKYNVSIDYMINESFKGSNKFNTFPYKSLQNIKNKKIRDIDIYKIIKKYGIYNKINNISKWQRAFVHKSYVYNDNYHDNIENDLYKRSYETYEWIGDRIIQSITCVYLMNRYPYATQDFYHKTQSKIVKKETLSKLSIILNLNKFLVISKIVEKNFGRKDYSNLEDCFEAFIGSFFLDLNNKDIVYGLNLTNKFYINIIEKEIDLAQLISINDDYKYLLMEYFHSNFNILPEYRTIKIYFKSEFIINKKIIESYTLEYKNGVTNKIDKSLFEKNKKKSYENCLNKVSNHYNIKRTNLITFLKDKGLKFNYIPNFKSEIYVNYKINYFIGVYHNDKLIGKYTNYNKKTAEKFAAKEALKYFNVKLLEF